MYSVLLMGDSVRLMCVCVWGCVCVRCVRACVCVRACACARVVLCSLKNSV